MSDGAMQGVGRDDGPGAVSERDVVEVYRSLLGREPESATVIQFAMRHRSLADLIRAVANSTEYNCLRRGFQTAVWGYTAIYDPIQIILRHAAKDLTPTPGFRTNYLGVKVDVDRFFPNLKIGKGVESAPIPANWHTDLAEFSAALRAVENAGRDFTMIELGCGWGCWMNITGAAARRAGKRARLISVEGDEGHVGFARDSLTENGFAEDQFIVHHGIVGPREGVAFFPRQSHAGVKWGLEPVIGPSPEDARRLRASGAFSELPMLSLRDVAEGRARIDLLHIDIQGGEVDFVRSCMEELNRVVAYVLVGTHSRAIDGELARAFTESGRWTLEIERPTFYSNVDGVLTTLVDGVQGWRNRSFDAK